MTVPNTTTYDHLLQELYSTERLVDLVHSLCPTLARVKKTTDLTGLGHVFSVKYGGNEAVNSTIAAAQAMVDGTRSEKFTLTRKKLLAVSRIDMELLDTAFANKGAFVDAMDEEVSHIENTFAARLGAQVFAGGGGALGQITSTSNVATKYIYVDPRDAHKFRPGQILEADDTDGTGGGAVKAGTEVLYAVDYDTGMLTATSAAWNTVIATIAASDHLFPQNQFSLGWAGFAAWCPASTTGLGTAFYGANRSLSPTLLAGHRQAATGGTMEDALITALTISPPNIKPKQCIMNPYRVGILLRENAGKSMYIRTDSTEQKMGASKLSILSPTSTGPLEIISDPFCQTDTVWFVDLDDVSIRGSKSGFVHIQKNRETGYMWFPVAAEDQIEMRMASYANMKHRNPGNILRVDF
jgi:hypothetical protein